METSNKYLEQFQCLHENIINTKFTDIKKYNYSDIDITRQQPCIYLFDKDMPSYNDFSNFVSNMNFHYTSKNDVIDAIDSPNMTKTIHKLKNNEYIFDTFNDEISKKYILQNFKPPKHLFAKNNCHYRTSRIYYGHQNFPILIHKHSSALNYLVKGKKLWIIFPSTQHNNVKFNEMEDIFNDNNNNVNDDYNKFLIENFNNIKNDIHDFHFFVQDEKEIVYIPDYWWHGLINLDSSLGITFSWEKDKK